MTFQFVKMESGAGSKDGSCPGPYTKVKAFSKFASKLLHSLFGYEKKVLTSELIAVLLWEFECYLRARARRAREAEI